MVYSPRIQMVYLSTGYDVYLSTAVSLWQFTSRYHQLIICTQSGEVTLTTSDFADFIGTELVQVVAAFGFAYQLEQRPFQ